MAFVPQFLYQIRPTRPEMLNTGPTERETQIVDAHFAYLKGLCNQGVVLMAGRTLNPDDGFGLVVVVAESQEQAAEVVANDPAVKDRVMTAALFPFRVALWSDRGPVLPD